MNFEEWFNEQEGSGLRSERAWDDTCSAQLAMFHIMRNWMQAAYEAGHKSREWEGLTKKEMLEAVDGLEDLEDCWVAIEAKLKDKNT